MASLTSLSVSTTPNFLCLLPLSFSSSSLITLKNPIRRKRSRNSLTYASSSSSLSSSSKPDHSPPTPTKKNTSNSFVESTVVSSPNLNYALPNPNGNSGNHSLRQFARSTEANIEKIIFDFRFLALFAIGGSLAGSLLCFLNGCVYIFDAYKVYMSCCMKGVHTGQMVLRLVEAIDVYLAGTVMFIFAMGLYGLFISNVSNDEPTNDDRAFKGSSLFGMFALKSRPSWMNISSLDELKTKVGHVIVMILLVKMFERSKMVTIATGLDLLSYSVCIFLSAASLYILHNLHKSD